MSTTQEAAVRLVDSQNDVLIPVVREEFHHLNILAVTAGTNVPQGGDTGHGGRTIFRLKDLGSTDMRVNGERADEVEIVMAGDAECETLIEALEFAAATLKGMLAVNRLNSPWR